MNISQIADRVRTLVVAFGLAAVASLGAANAYAAAPAKVTPEQALADAPAIIASAKANCTPVAANVLGPTEYEKADKTKVKGQLYEIACQAGPGFIVTVVSPTEAYQPFTCTLAAGLLAKNPKGVSCLLPENTPDYKWLTPVVQPYVPGCDVSAARVIGTTTNGSPADVYEVVCGANAGGVVEYPAFGSDAKVDFHGCMMGEGTASACTLNTHDQIVASVKPIAAKADADCQVSDARFVGVTTKDPAGYFYEFGCANKPGFIALTDMNNNFDRSITCANATNLGGCKFTDTTAAVSDAAGQYTKILKDAGYPCTVTAFDLKGNEPRTKRDYIEFKCVEQPFGILGLIPQPDSQSTVRVNDCFYDALRTAGDTPQDPFCTYVTLDQLKAQWDKLIKIAHPDKGCDVTQVRYIGESDTIDQGVVAELACANKRGYIAVINTDRQSLVDAEPCNLAKTRGEDNQCTIPGNGTYIAN